MSPRGESLEAGQNLKHGEEGRAAPWAGQQGQDRRLPLPALDQGRGKGEERLLLTPPLGQDRLGSHPGHGSAEGHRPQGPLTPCPPGETPPEQLTDSAHTLALQDIISKL